MRKNTIQVWAPSLTMATDVDLSSAVASVKIPVSASKRKMSFVRLPPSVSDLGILPDSVSTPNFPKISGRMKAYNIDMSVLTDNLKRTLADFQKTMDDLPKTASGYCIDEIEINLGVNGKGGISLIGRLEVGIEAAIKVKIKRKP